MSAKQDRAAPRTVSDFERRYNFGKTFAELLGIAQAAQDASELAIKQLEGLTAEEVFNILTDGGTDQGIYRIGGKIYLNASYIQSGLLLADLIAAGVLQSKDGKTFYLDLDNGVLKGQFAELSIGGKSVATKDDLNNLATTEDLNAFEDSVTKDIESIQSQLDGNITSWFYDHVPTMDNEPAVSWTTDADKNIHLGDLFYVIDNEESGGLVYRWALVNGSYQWTLVEDSEVAKALAQAAEAKDIADGKRRVFVVQPIPPYDVGDLWAQGGEGDLMLCTKARTKNESCISTDWERASKYIDADKAGDIAQGKVDAQKQEDIFNKLTDNGKAKGIFLEDGELYISATYIKSGRLVADLIQAGVLQSNDGETFYLDLENGILKGKFTEFSVAGKRLATEEYADGKAFAAEANSNQYTDQRANEVYFDSTSYADDAISAQTQQDIFNKLTNNGEEQGIYLKDGKLYINASYLASGVIASRNGGVVIDLLNDNFELRDIDSGGRRSRLSYTGSSLRFGRSHADTDEMEDNLTISAGLRGSTGLPLNSITAQNGTNLILNVNADKSGNKGYIGVGLAGAPVKIMGKTVSWEANGDGTYTLIGRD